MSTVGHSSVMSDGVFVLSGDKPGLAVQVIRQR
jgi:hypothetical protein